MADQYETNNAARDVREGASLVQARDIGQVILNSGVEAGPEPERDPWVAAVMGSSVWRHVPEGRDTEPFRVAVVEFVRSLVPLRDEAQERLREDPWLDPGVPLRFHDRMTQLLGSPGQAEDLDFYPAEAALLVFTPFLFRVYELRRMVALADLGPGSLKEVEGPSAERRSFEAFVCEYRVLTERVRRRGQDEAAVGWWLFHRWVLKAENSVGVDDLWGQAPELFHRLWKTERVKHFLHGLRLGPGVCNPEHLEGLREDEYMPVEGAQQLRDRRLGLILALGFGMSLEAASLPETVLEHLAIPHPVDPVRLQDTVEGATWGSDRHLLTLSAECHHEAVIEGLREHVQRVDELLHGVHRSLRAHVANLPSRLSADLVEPAEGAFDGWARFRIDERRARELLTGEQLYKNKDLAIRELYQNALDACRYRRARTQYLDRCNPLASFEYEGRIEFIQGMDDDGRAYVDCIDNGVGMGEAELRGVFSHAGSRFAEQPDFLREKEKWEQLDPPVELYPNSRFGIGVLSYFMIADEIRVTTCRMHADGSLAPELEASIHGPGHLFRIVRTDLSTRTPGTTIRLYLKEKVISMGAWSCVDALRAVLVIAEYRTAVSKDGKSHIWEPGDADLDCIQQPFLGEVSRSDDIVIWEGSPEGVDVTWYQGAGQLLVDGLAVTKTGLFSGLSYDPKELTNVVVNLSGAYAPKKLSVDRSEVLSDVSDLVLELIEGAAEDLVGKHHCLWDDNWFIETIGRTHRVGDILTLAATRANVNGGSVGGRLCQGKAGYVPLDAHILGINERKVGLSRKISKELAWGIQRPSSTYPVEAGFLIWRLLLVGQGRVSEELINRLSEVPDGRELKSGVPTDQVLALDGSHGWKTSLPSAFRSGVSIGLSAEEVVQRWSDLRVFPGAPSEHVSQIAEIINCGSEVESLVFGGGISFFGEIDPISLAQVAYVRGVGVRRAADLVRSLGAVVNDEIVASAELARLGSLRSLIYENGMGSWIGQRGRVPLSIFSEALNLPPFETCDFINECGRPGISEMLAERALLKICSDSSLNDTEALNLSAGIGHFVRPDKLKYGDLISESRKGGVPLDFLVRRLRDCGVSIPLEFCRRKFDLSSRGVSGYGEMNWGDVTVSDPIPLSVIIANEYINGVDASLLIDFFDELGVEVSRENIPDDLNYSDVIRLIFRDVDSKSFGFIDPTWSLPLSYFVVMAQQMGVSLDKILEWYLALGYRVPSLEKLLPDAVRHIPRRG